MDILSSKHHIIKIKKGVAVLCGNLFLKDYFLSEEYQEPCETNEGTVIYHIKYDYDAISIFLLMSRDEYEQN